MLYIFGDSHGEFSFKGLSIPHENYRMYSVTMHRVGRDNQILGFQRYMNSSDNTFVFVYGEVDCRCHVGKQVLLGRNKIEVCKTLVSNYIQAIKNHVTAYKQIIVCSITPAANKEKFEAVHGVITHEFPFVGTNADRVENTRIMNYLLKKSCYENGFTFFDYTDEYSDEAGCLNWEKSDKNSHIQDNTYLLNKFCKLLT